MVDNPYKYPYVPIGGIIEWDGTGLTGAPDLSTPEKVAAVYGYGTWEAYGAGRVTVGAGSGYAVGSEGGEERHKLTENEMPAHSHFMGGASATAPNGIDFPAWFGVSYGNTGSTGGRYYPIGITNSGNNASHNNLQPYRAVYRYRRIA